MLRYIRRSDIVEAVRWFEHGDHDAVVPIPDKLKDYIPIRRGATGYIELLDGGVFVKPGDWIITAADSQLDACEPAAFDMLYREL